jgi:RHS repeat-associated protein
MFPVKHPQRDLIKSSREAAMLSTLTSANRHPLVREFVWFVIFAFTISSMPHLDFLFPLKIRFLPEAEAGTLEETLPDLADLEPPLPSASTDTAEGSKDKSTETSETAAETATGESSAGSSSSSSEYSEQITPSFSFKVDDFTGAAHLSYPISVPPAREGLVPQVSISYSSSGGNGWLGVGFELSQGYIQRRGPRKGVPTYNDSTDVFELVSGGSPQELVYVSEASGVKEYRLKIEGALLRVRYITGSNKWEVTDKNGLVMRFGQSDASRVLRTAPYGSGTYRWAVDELEDLKGNWIQVSYQKPAHSPGQIYLDEIKYNGNKTSGFAHNQSVKFNIEGTDRPDPIYNYRGGFKSLTKRRLASIEIKTRTGAQQWSNVRKYVFQYVPIDQYGRPSARSLLSSITLYGSDFEAGLSLPPTAFTYQTLTPGFNIEPVIWSNPSAWGDINGNHLRTTNSYGTKTGLYDINGDGLIERVVYDRWTAENQTWGVYFNNGTDGFIPLPEQGGEEQPNWPNPSAWNAIYGNFVRDTTGAKYDILDMDGDGYIDRVVYDKDSPYNTWEFYRNNGSEFIDQVGWPNPSATGPTAGNYIRSVNEGGTYREVIDLNADGLPDRVVYNENCTSPYTNCPWTVYYSNGAGFVDPGSPNWPNPSAQSNVIGNYMRNSNGGKYDLVDINGDGLVDHVFWDQTSPYETWVVFFNYGSGFDGGDNGQGIEWSNPSAWGSIDGNYLRDTGANKYDLIDMNGDGLVDRVVFDRWNRQDRPWKVYFNLGDRFAAGVDWPNPGHWNTGDNYGNFIRDTDGNKFDVIDLDGNGLPDRLIYDTEYNYDPDDPQPALWKVYLNNGPTPDLLSKAENGIGGSVEISYLPSTVYRSEETGALLNHIPFVVQTVSSYTQKDGRQAEGHGYTNRYTYSGGYYNPVAVEFMGFQTVTAKQMQTPAGSGWEAMTETKFHQRDQSGQPDEYRKGKPETQTVTSRDGHIRITDYVWNTGYDTLGGGKFPALDSVTTTVKDKDGESYHQYSTETRYVYDVQPGSLSTQTLNLKEEYKNEGATGPGEEIRSFTDYEQLDWDKRVLSRPTRVTVKDKDGGVYSRKWMDYDGDDKRLVREEFCKTGDPTPVADNACAKNSGNNPVIQYTYDTTYKMLKDVIDPRGYKTSYAYDSTNTHIEQTTNCIDLDCTAAKSHVTTMLHDPGTGYVVKLVPPHLQGTDYWLQTKYDKLGRKTLERLKDNSNPDTDPLVDRGWTAYEYNFSNNANTQYVKKQEQITVVVPTSEHPSPPPACTGLPECKIDSRTLTHEAYTYFDGLGRAYKQTSTGPETPLIVVTTDYEPDINRVWRKSIQRFEGETPYYTEFDYDGFSRVIITTTPDDQIIETAYKGLDKVVTNQRGYTTTYTMDLNGKTVGITDAYETLTTYEFDVMGNLRTVTAAVGESEENTTAMSYNSLSKKIGMSDPDMGSWLYEYDSSGNLALQTDAKGQKIRFGYLDGLNRVTRKHYGDPNPDSTVIYTYDDSAIPYSKGKLTSVSYEPSGEDLREDLVLELDQLQRVKYSSKQTGSLVKEFKKTYDSASRVITVTYLVGTGSEKKYNYVYDRAGNLLSLQDDDTSAMVVRYSDFTALGQPLSVVFQNSVTTTYTYYPDTGRVNTIETVKPGTPSTVYQDLTYTYDEVGDVTVIEDALNNLTHTYGYDPLNRLDRAKGDGGTVYDHDYNYDRIGNIKSKTDAGGDYEYTISNKPHAVRKIWTDSNHTVQKYGFEYDANGNMTQRQDLTGAQEVRLDLVYNYDNMPVSVDKTVGQTLTTTVTFVYDGNGQRVKKVNQTGQTTRTTYYFGELYEEREGSGDFIHIFAGSRRVATVPVESGCTRFYHPNHLGSASVVTKDDGDWVEKIEYFPFGTYRDRQDNDETCPNVNYTFTDQEDDDDIGLYNYGARLYDPLIGRFISPDTIVPYPNDPQTLNRYSYVNNNPLIYTDPSGNIFLVDDLAIILGSMLAAKLIVSAAAGAVLGAGMAAATGGNIGMGALTGAISGMAFAGAGALVGELGLAGAGATFGDKLATVGIHAAAGAISGGINSAITGGNIGIGALTGAISGGIGMAVGSLNFIPKDFGYQLASRSFAGAVSGGIAAELSGGDFWEGFRQGAMTAAAGYLFNCVLSKMTQQRWRELENKAVQGESTPPLARFLDKWIGHLSWGVGGVLGIVDINWTSSNPLETNLNIATPQIGGGLNLCFTYDLSKPSGASISAGSDYLGVSVDTKFNTFCVNIGGAWSASPINLSAPATSIRYE